ncbi:hypothetical protein TrST_g8370 [Triparma strigata]|uniref:Gamma-soluble NSF attachment protein n=1 Tax=Triparma strigata TaxID=1606541 RepID=A0A9W6ZV17_9STRA|nr:hypothetical protein TrST_g8370 [Triparma strigata]
MSYRSNITGAKNELFSTSTKPKAKPSSSSTRPAAKTSSSYDYSKHAAKTSSASSLPKCFLSAEAKAKKEKEAMEARDSAKKAMQSGFFTSADPLAAYGYYKKAADCYKSTCDFKKEAMMRRSAASCQMTNGHFSSAASEYKLAAKCHSNLDDYSSSSEDYRNSGVAWTYANDNSRCGEMLLESAKELDRGGLPGAAAAFEQAVESLCPDANNTFAAFRANKSESDGLGQLCTGAFVGEQLWSVVKHFVERKQLSSALYALGALTEYYENDTDSTSTLYKTYFTTSIVQISLGDIVAAEKTYMEKHLQRDSYLPTDECRIAEDMIRAVKDFDSDKVESLKKERKVNNMDVFVRSLVMEITSGGKVGGIKSSKSKPKPTPAPAPKKPAPDAAADDDDDDDDKELEEAMADLGAELDGVDVGDDEDDEDEIDLT